MPRHAGGGVQYRLTLADGSKGTSPVGHTSLQIGESLVARGIAYYPNPEYRDLFALTPEAIEWYLDLTAPTETDLRRQIGQVLYKAFLRDEDAGLTAKELSEQTGLALDEVEQQVRVLKKIEHVKQIWGWHPASVRAFLFDEPADFSEPYPDPTFRLEGEGIRWALSGFPEIPYGQSTNINLGIDVRIHLNVEIDKFIDQIEGLMLPRDFKQQLIEAMREVKNEPTQDKVQKVIGLVSDTTTSVTGALLALPYIINFIAASATSFNQLWGVHLGR